MMGFCETEENRKAYKVLFYNFIICIVSIVIPFPFSGITNLDEFKSALLPIDL